MKRLAAATTVLLVTMIVGDIVVAQQPPAGARFDVASVRPVLRDSPSFSISPIRIMASGQLVGRTVLRNIIHLSYGAEPYERTVGASPETSRFLEEIFEVNALPPASPSPPTREEVKSMARQMLAERFGLRLRIDTELVSATVLRVIKRGVLGRGLRPAPEGCSELPSGVNPYDAKFADAYRRSCNLTMFDGRFRGIVSLDEFARIVSFTAGRPILNRTGLEGMFAFDATIDMTSLVQDAPSRLGARVAGPTGQSGVQAFVDALRDQMGLSARTEERQPVRLFVVEQVGPFVEN